MKVKMFVVRKKLSKSLKFYSDFGARAWTSHLGRALTYLPSEVERYQRYFPGEEFVPIEITYKEKPLKRKKNGRSRR